MSPTYTTDTPRGPIAQAIHDAHPDWHVVDYPDDPDHLARGRVFAAVYRSAVAKDAATVSLSHSLTVDLYVSPRLAPEAEAVLDDRLDDLLLVIAGLPSVTWERAERTAFDAFHGWRVTLTAHSADVYSQHVRSLRS